MPRKKQAKTKPRKRSKKSGIAGWVIIFLTIFIMVFVLSMLMTPSEVTVVQTERGVVRVQILNGCGASGAGDEMTRALAESSNQIFFDVIDRGNADVYNFDKTLVIDRRGNKEAGHFSKPAYQVAHLLSTGPDELLIQRLSDNLLDIDVTIIVGADYKSIINNMKRGKTAVES
jgi:hypothetical protein